VTTESPFVHIYGPLKDDEVAELKDFTNADNIFKTLLRQNPDDEDKKELEELKKGMPQREVKSEETILGHRITGLLVSQSDTKLLPSITEEMSLLRDGGAVEQLQTCAALL
jgi:hypothetical protein